jgi:hypothetical protein
MKTPEVLACAVIACLMQLGVDGVLHIQTLIGRRYLEMLNSDLAPPLIAQLCVKAFPVAYVFPLLSLIVFAPFAFRDAREKALVRLLVALLLATLILVAICVAGFNELIVGNWMSGLS